MKYLPMTQEQMNKIRKMFDNSSFEKPKFDFNTEADGYYITVSKMYEYVGFKGGESMLSGYLKIAEILDCKNGDEVSRYSYPGCETCDYGSQYTIKLKFW